MAASADQLAVGVDAGGTRVRVVALRGERVVARRELAAEGDLIESLRAVWRANRWRRVGSLVVASRGVWTPAERRAMRARVASLAEHVEAIADVEAAHLGALGGEPGVLLLAGTGSIALGRGSRGAWVRKGGLGPLLGDEGSGFWIGRESLRAGPPARAREMAGHPDAVARIAALARGVIGRARRGSRPDAAIVKAAQGHLAALAASVARELDLASPGISWAGSLLEQESFRAGVARALARLGVRATWREPVEAPALAAARLAARYLHAP